MFQKNQIKGGIKRELRSPKIETFFCTFMKGIRYNNINRIK
jgi:hypothetical protein